MSVEPDAETVAEAAADQPLVPPATTGAVGGVVSILTVLPRPADDGAHAETLPAPSIARICTMVVPSPVMAAGAATAADHVLPPSVDVRYWYPESPEPPASVEPDAVMVTGAVACQLADPPVTDEGAVGLVR